MIHKKIMFVESQHNSEKKNEIKHGDPRLAIKLNGKNIPLTSKVILY